MSPVPTLDHVKATFTTVDGSENSGSTSHYVGLGTVYGDLDALFEAHKALTACALESYTLAAMGTDPTNNGVAGVYNQIEDDLIIIMQAGDNSEVPYQVAGPIATIFQSDGKTLNPVAAAVATMIVEILAIIVTKGGVILIDYVRGYRKGRKARKNKPGVVYNPAR